MHQCLLEDDEQIGLVVNGSNVPSAQYAQINWILTKACVRLVDLLTFSLISCTKVWFAGRKKSKT